MRLICLCDFHLSFSFIIADLVSNLLGSVLFVGGNES